MIDERRIAEIRAQVESAPDESAIVHDVKVWLPKAELLQLVECYEAARAWVHSMAEHEDLVEALGLIADTCENGLAAASLQVPPAIHVQGLKGILRDILKRARAATEGATDG